MTIKNRIAKLEKKNKAEVKAGDVFTVRRIDYRADIDPEVKAAGGAIPVRFVDMTAKGEGEG